MRRFSGAKKAAEDALEFLFADRIAVVAQHLEAPLGRVGQRRGLLEVAGREVLDYGERGVARAVGAGIDEPFLRQRRRGGQQQRHQPDPQAAARSAVGPAA